MISRRSRDFHCWDFLFLDGLMEKESVYGEKVQQTHFDYEALAVLSYQSFVERFLGALEPRPFD